MMPKNKLIPVAVLLLTLGASMAYADESEPKNFSTTIGLKLWANEWQTWDTPSGYWFGGAAMGTAKAISPNPSVTLKYKNFFVSGGTMLKTTYKMPDTLNGATTTASRWEKDLSVGYFVHPQVAVTLGYKQITQKWGSTYYVWKIPAVGLSLAAAIQDTKMFMYGNAAVGAASVSTSDNTAAGWRMKGGNYTTTEIGLGYSVIPSFRLTLGYKYQVCPTSMEVLNNTSRVTMVDSTRGFVFGGSYTF